MAGVRLRAHGVHLRSGGPVRWRAMAVDSSVRIEVAGPEHLPAVVELAEAGGSGAAPEAGPGRRGFLASARDVDDYQDLLVRGEHFYVALAGDRVVGFAVAYSGERIAPDEWLNLQIRARLDDFVVMTQVCVDPDHSAPEIAALLYEHVLARTRGLPVVVAMVLEPVNAASVAFHARLGFAPMLELTPPDGRRRLVMCHAGAQVEVLVEQYPVAVDLYRHEDRLNWSRLTNLLYVTVGLLAVLGLSAPGSGPLVTGHNRIVVLAVCVIGLLASLTFGIALWSGAQQMQSRKAAVTALEVSLSQAGGLPILGRGGGGLTRWLRQPPATLVLRTLPAAIAACWLVVAVVAVLP